MSASIQGDLWGPQLADVDEDAADASTDSYCTPPEVCEPIVAAAGGLVHHDPWTNRYAITHGWLRARTAWTIVDGRSPGIVRKDGSLDITPDPRPWPLAPGQYCHGNPPYSDPLPFVLRFILEMERAKAWGMLLLKSDNRTEWARALLERRQPIVLWDGVINFFHKGQRVKGNNFASTLYVVDGTGTDPQRRADMLSPIFEGKAWVYR
jgi:hypothetical protein